MIVIHVAADGVQKAFIHADSDFAEDAALAIWPLVREQLKLLDNKLRDASTQQLEQSGHQEEGSA